MQVDDICSAGSFGVNRCKMNHFKWWHVTNWWQKWLTVGWSVDRKITTMRTENFIRMNWSQIAWLDCTFVRSFSSKLRIVSFLHRLFVRLKIYTRYKHVLFWEKWFGRVSLQFFVFGYLYFWSLYFWRHREICRDLPTLQSKGCLKGANVLMQLTVGRPWHQQQ